MEMEKKNLAIIILAVVLAASGVGNIILGIQTGAITIIPEEKETLIIGTLSGPVDLDPVDSWDSASWDVINQVCEGLLFYDPRDPDLPLIPMLATDYTFADSTHIDFNLRTGVTFHDGTAFNADAAVWNFDRLALATYCDKFNSFRSEALYESEESRFSFKKQIFKSDHPGISYLLECGRSIKLTPDNFGQINPDLIIQPPARHGYTHWIITPIFDRGELAMVLSLASITRYVMAKKT